VFTVTEIIVALITGSFALVGVIISNKSAKKEITQQIMINQAVTDTKIEELTREVREHNNFAKRMPVVENEIEHLVEDVHKLQTYHTN
jgi:isochorismate hydrolase